MSLNKQSDVKNHLSSRYRTKVHLRESVLDATGLSVAEPDAIKANASDFAADFLAEHSLSGVAAAPDDPVARSISAPAAAVSKNARA